MQGIIWASAARGAALASIVVVWTSAPAAAQAVPAPWTSIDIGQPALAGTASESSGTFTLEAAGADSSGVADQLHFVYQAVSGDVEIVARVDTLDPQHAWSRVGVMIRGSLAADSAHGWAVATNSQGLHFEHRVAAGTPAAMIAGRRRRTPVWLRARRQGNRVIASWSLTGTSWSTIGTETVALGSVAYVGVALTSQNASARAMARVAAVSVTRVGLPVPQQSTDIGSPAVKGVTAYQANTYSIIAGGRDIGGQLDEFHFVFQPLTGDGEVIARVASLSRSHQLAKAGVMIRESLTAESRHAMALVTSGRGYGFQTRLEPGESSSYTPGGSGTAPGWLRLVRAGHRIDAYRSADGASWTLIGSNTVVMENTVYVGLAVTSYSTTSAVEAVIDGFRVVAPARAVNQPPAISLTAPAAGSRFTALQSIAVTATATDPENRMLAVDFYAGSTLIGRDATSPYSISWLPPALASFVLTAVAHDADGNSSVSSNVTVTFEATTATVSVPRAVSFTASADHSTGVSSYVLEIFAGSVNPSVTLPLVTSDLGKPAHTADGTITVDRSAVFSALAPGTYLGTVTAIGPGGRSRSAAVTFTR